VGIAVTNRLPKGAIAVAIAAALTTTPERELPPETVANSSQNPVRLTQGMRRGRPRKFNGPSRSVTLTLPEDTIVALRAIDRDISRAVVRAIQPLVPHSRPLPAELATYGDQAVIVVPASGNVRERTGVELVPLPDGRALICFDERMSISEFELRVRDVLADSTVDGEDRDLYETLANILKNARRSDSVALERRSIIVLQSQPKTAREPAPKPSEIVPESFESTSKDV
jgi:hypothetical protein